MVPFWVLITNIIVRFSRPSFHFPHWPLKKNKLTNTEIEIMSHTWQRHAGLYLSNRWDVSPNNYHRRSHHMSYKTATPFSCTTSNDTSLACRCTTSLSMRRHEDITEDLQRDSSPSRRLEYGIVRYIGAGTPRWHYRCSGTSDVFPRILCRKCVRIPVWWVPGTGNCI